jgi:hypothetical protein
MNDEEFRAIVDQGPLIVMVEKGHLLALLDERDELREERDTLRAALTEVMSGLDEIIEFAHDTMHEETKQ